MRIKQSIGFILFALILACTQVLALQVVSVSPLGYWQSIDDHDHKPRAIIHIWKARGQLFGKIIKTYLRSGEKYTDVCHKCSGRRHDKRILGMTILWGMTGQGRFYNGGQILDPKNGSTYNCKMSVAKNDKTMEVRGYIGLPLFGRSQTWRRVSKPTHLPSV